MILQSTDAVKTTPGKIVSLVPSLTELLYDLGLEKEVIGITKFCVHPNDWIKTKVIVGGTKNVRLDTIRQLSPDIIITNKEENVKDQIETLANDFDVWLTDVNTLDETLQMIKDLGKITRTDEKAELLVNSIQNNFTEIHKSKFLNTCYLIWQEPYMTVGNDTFINDMMSHCGFENIFADKTRYPELQIEELKERNCELLILSSEPYPFKQKHADELQQQLPGTKIILADGEMFSWYGSRLLHAPKYFDSLINNI